MIALFVNLSEEDANTCLLVLASAGIFCRITGQPDNWTVSVHPEDIQKALEEIEKYFQENREIPDEEETWSSIPHKIHVGIGAALGLLVSHIFMIHHGGISFFAEKYGASASSILNGESYRTVTALMIHADSVHLAGNMASLALFFTVVCSVQGFGVGFFCLLVSGALGNYMTALLYGSGHYSIGASTTVFGAVGILIAHQTFSSFRVSKQRFRAWLPLGGGLCLLGLFSEGAHTDILAHLFGLGSGMAVGCIYECLQKKPPGYSFQYLFFSLTLAVMLLSWLRMG
ncbi:MAG: rhomboid family intramembrane serine protease [Deltaproteobacteria bacterium]|nr:rhomboid family intramembrane serine protease [Deltaproteobacteria bacterium]